MKLGVLCSGGKDSLYAAYLAKKAGHELACLISVASENAESLMFHTPNINLIAQQAQAMNIPLIMVTTKGKKELELIDLCKAIVQAKKKYGLGGVVSGAVGSVYQSSRIQKICNDLNITCFNPLWQKSQLELLNELISNSFEVIIVGVFAYPLDAGWLGKKVDKAFISQMRLLEKKYGINPAGEGGEFESLVLNCPLFKKKLALVNRKISGEKYSWVMEVTLA